MSAVLKILYVIFSPVLAILYWRNAMRSLDEIYSTSKSKY